MGVVVSVVVGAVLTLPISSAAICAAIGLSGSAVLAGLADGSATLEIWNGLSLAGGAATAGCCAHMPVSYTHLDVYKRQAYGYPFK